MLYEKKVVEKFGRGKKARGFRAIKYSLFYDCVQDIAKLSLDSDHRTPSVQNIISIIENEKIKNVLQKNFSTWAIPIAEEEDELTIKALKKITKREQEKLREEFNKKYSEIINCWESFRNKPYISAFKVIRDKLTAHLELKKINGEYQYTDISKLGLKWGDLKKSIYELEEIILNLNLIIRNASFAMESLNDSLSKANKAFWE